MNSKHIETFIDNMVKEANAAAQAVYDSHTPALIELIQKSLREGQTIFTGMGSVHAENKNGDYILESLTAKLQTLEFPGKLSDAAPAMPNTLTKNHIK